MIDVILIDCINCLKESVLVADPREDQNGKIVRKWEDIPVEDRFDGEIHYDDLCLKCEDLCQDLMTKQQRQLTFARQIESIKES